MVPAVGGQLVQITKGMGPDVGMKISTDLKKLLYYEKLLISSQNCTSFRAKLHTPLVRF
jgi:hypothetical protein